VTPDDRATHTAAERLHAKAREYRGRFLNLIAVIERNLALLLTEYFCTSDSAKQEFFFDRIACKMSLEEKRTLLMEIGKRDYPTLWQEHTELLKDLQELQTFRNKLAHSVLDVSPAALARPLDHGVGFVQWKKGTPITEEEMDKWCVRANMVNSTLATIKLLFPFKEREADA
jgi:hypothetical protein